MNAECREWHSVAHYSDKLCITPNYLNELIKKETGFTAKQTINDRLLVEAKKMLQYSQNSITEIAEALNFENTSYFIRFFRNQQNITPLEFRNKSKA